MYGKLNIDGTLQSANKQHEGFIPLSDFERSEIKTSEFPNVGQDGFWYAEFYQTTPNAEGMYLKDDVKIAEVATEAEQAEFRLERNKELALVDIEINKAEDAGGDTTELRVYRQALRDATIDWVMPSKPEGV